MYPLLIGFLFIINQFVLFLPLSFQPHSDMLYGTQEQLQCSTMVYGKLFFDMVVCCWHFITAMV